MPVTSDFATLTLIGFAILSGAMSPGASFLLAARTAVSCSFSAAAAGAVGLASGAAIFAGVALSGLHAVLLYLPGLYLTLKIAGGLYLLWVAIKILRRSAGATVSGEQNIHHSIGRAFLSGLLTQLSNPATALVFASLFSSVLSSASAPRMSVTLPAMAFIIDVLWYLLVAALLSARRPRHAYLRYRPLIDRCSAGLLAFTGLKLLFR